jgi:N-acetylglutamate synthase-like GNAT family acetyltransferase
MPCGTEALGSAGASRAPGAAPTRVGADVSGGVEIRREPRAGDLEAIVEHHGRVYSREYRVNSDFKAMVAKSVAEAGSRGWPTEREAIWIVERDGLHAGSMGLTDEGDTGVVRWVLLDPDLRGQGLGRRLLNELLAKAREIGYERLRLETFSDLRAAAHLYLEAGFRVVRQDTRPRWGRDSITYQHYELELAPAQTESTQNPVAASA